MNPPSRERLFRYLACLLLAVITCAAYASVSHNLFIALDDQDYVVNNLNIQQGFTWKSIKWAFTAYYASNWHPVTWLSHILDCQLYGLSSAGPHLTNLAFHVTNTVLLFFLGYYLTSRLWPSTFVAMLFGIHPMHVESVAWVSERKDVLSAFFFLLTLLSYARYVELYRAKKSVAWAVYILALLLFALGLMAKPMLVTLPGILLLLDYWPLQRIQWPLHDQPKSVWRRLLVEKIPFILLTALSCWITYSIQNSTGAVKLGVLDSTTQRINHMPVAYAWYVLKYFWPVNLSVYDRLPYQESEQQIFWGTLLLVAITAFAVWRFRKYPWFFVGWFWFVGMLVPVIGLVQVGNQAYADRYTYLPYIGLFFIIAWGAMELSSKLPRQQWVLCLFGLLITVLLFWRTIVETHYWESGLSLFNRSIEVDPKDEMAWMLAGLEYQHQGNYDKVIDYLTHATVLNNQFNLAWYNLGRAYALKKDYSNAINAYESAAACAWYDGDKVNIYNSLGDACTATGQFNEAIANYQDSLQINPGQPYVQSKLAQALINNNQSDQAIDAYQNAISLNPNYLEAQLGLAMLLDSTGHDAEAIPHYRKVIELDTNVLAALNNLAWIMATDSDPRLRDGKGAVPLALHACERTDYQEAFLIGTLAAAYAEAGQFDQAAAMAQKARDVALAHGQKGIADSNAQLLQLYKSGKAFHIDIKTPLSKPSS
jgi:tetratricopeptide (TPR) repeat protein